VSRPTANDDIVRSPRRAGARAHLRAMGLDERDWSRPLVGIATTWTGTMPCNLGQRVLAQHVAEGVREAGGTPLEFNTIAISDNLTQGMPGMRASLVSREVIADSIELVGVSQPLDGLVVLDQPHIAHHLCPKARVNQVQDGVLDTADVLVDSLLAEPILRRGAIKRSSVVTSVGIAVKIPG